MKNWLKENWFKTAILFIVFLYTLIFAYEQYRESVIHNERIFRNCLEGMKTVKTGFAVIVDKSPELLKFELCQKLFEPYILP